jgi:hypothetical protein
MLGGDAALAQLEPARFGAHHVDGIAAHGTVADEQARALERPHRRAFVLEGMRRRLRVAGTGVGHRPAVAAVRQAHRQPDPGDGAFEGGRIVGGVRRGESARVPEKRDTSRVHGLLPGTERLTRWCAGWGPPDVLVFRAPRRRA